MVELSNVIPFAALLVGVILIAAYLWFDARREDRRQYLVRSLQSVLENEQQIRPRKKLFQRAA